MSFPRVANNGLFSQNPIDPSWLLGNSPLPIFGLAAYGMLARAFVYMFPSTGAGVVTDPTIAPGPQPAGLIVAPLLWGPQRAFLAFPPFEQT